MDDGPKIDASQDVPVMTDATGLAGSRLTLLGLDTLIVEAEAAAGFLKALGHDGRLSILCHLLRGPKSVTELESLVQMRQAVVSQQLARLRLEGLVSTRREGQAIYYSLRDPKVSEMLRVLCEMFGTPTSGPSAD